MDHDDTHAALIEDLEVLMQGSLSEVSDKREPSDCTWELGSETLRA